MVEINNIYREEWQKMYPGVQFPTPQKYPHMFPEGAYTQEETYYIDPFGSQCSHPSVCPKGLIDYKCQMEKECYLNLLQLGLSLLGFLFGTIIFLIVVGKVTKIIYNFVTGIIFIHKVIDCFTSCLKCFSLGFFEINYVQVQIVNQIKNKKFKKMAKKLNEKLGIQIYQSDLNQRKIKHIQQILDDYTIRKQFD